jgi:hypothetical protein
MGNQLTIDRVQLTVVLRWRRKARVVVGCRSLFTIPFCALAGMQVGL